MQAFSAFGAATPPDAVGAGHVDQLQEVATAISSWDNRFGGGMVRGIAEPAMQWATGLLHAQCPPRLRPNLHAAVSRLGLVVGAAGFDIRAVQPADLPQPVDVDGRPATFWHELPPHTHGSTAQVAQTLRELHDLPQPTELGLGRPGAPRAPATSTSSRCTT